MRSSPSIKTGTSRGVNEWMVKIAQKPSNELIGRNFLDVFLPRPEDRETEYWKQYHHVMEARKPATFVDHYKALNIWTQVRAYPKSDGGMAVFFTDISEAKTSRRSARHRKK